MNILITGATGTIGTELIKQITEQQLADKIYAMARNEARMALLLSKFPNIHPIYGDITDHEKVRRAVRPADIIIHAAAMKRVDACEYDKLEAVKTNIEGTKNLLLASEEHDVKIFCFLSTDKAVEPITFYGYTKAVAEQLVISFNRDKVGGMKTLVCRYGNVWNSTGSVYGMFKEAIKQGKPLHVRHREATRFFWRIDRAARFILSNITEPVWGGATFYPEMKSLRIADLADYLCRDTSEGYCCPIEYGQGFVDYPEKVHEKLDGDTCSKDFVQEGEKLETFIQELMK